MEEPRFWNIIEQSRALDLGSEEALSSVLRQLDPDDIRAFERRFRELWRKAYRWDIWSAVWWIHGYCSDDAFMDFRARLISMGRDRYFATLSDPDSLAEIVGTPEGEYSLLEGYLYVPRKVYEERTGGPMPFDDEPESYPELRDKDFDPNDVEIMRRKFPRVLQRLPWPGGIDPSTVHVPERKLEWLGDWNDDKFHDVLTHVLGEPVRGEDVMESRAVTVRIDDESADVEYTPIMGVFVKDAPRVVDHIVAAVTSRLHRTPKQ